MRLGTDISSSAAMISSALSVSPAGESAAATATGVVAPSAGRADTGGGTGAREWTERSVRPNH